MILNAVYGITQALHWTSKWDYFINLSASDLPLIATVSICLAATAGSEGTGLGGGQSISFCRICLCT